MSKISTLNKSLLFMLIFTIVSSFLAYRIVVRAYSVAFSLEVMQ